MTQIQEASAYCEMHAVKSKMSDHLPLSLGNIELPELLASISKKRDVLSTMIHFTRDQTLTKQETETLLKEIASIPNLKKLKLLFQEGAHIPFDALANFLDEANELTEIYFDCVSLTNTTNSNTSSDDYKCFTQSLEKHTSLKEFKLSFKYLVPGSAMLDSIVTALSNVPTLEKLFLFVKPYLVGPCLANLSSSSSQLICQFPNLKNLKIIGLQLGEEHVHKMAQTLCSNKVLKELGMCNCDLSGKSATIFADMLRVNSSLEKLDLSYNHIDDIGCLAFAQSLEVNSTLQNLYLFKNESVGTPTYQAFVRMLERNFTLNDLWITIDEEQMIQTIQFYLRLNRTGKRHVLRNVNAAPSEFVDTLTSSQNNLSELFYYLSNSPASIPSTAGETKKQQEQTEDKLHLVVLKYTKKTIPRRQNSTTQKRQLRARMA